MMKETIAVAARKGTERLGRVLGDARGGGVREIRAKNGGARSSRLVAAAPVLVETIRRRCRLKVANDGSVQVVVTLVRAPKKD